MKANVCSIRKSLQGPLPPASASVRGLRLAVA
jgi:hypothetical protein